jgi:FkbM family methyltransferase
MFRALETRLRFWRLNLTKKLLSGPRARKRVADFLPNSITRVTMDCVDHTLTFNPHELIGRRIFTYGHFERNHTTEVLDWLKASKRLNTTRDVVVEIGANIGTQTIYFALDPAVRSVIAIEPDPENFELLDLNVSANRLNDKVVMCDVAIAPEAGELTIYTVKGNSGNSSLLQLPNSVPSGSIKAAPLADVLAESGTPAERIALIWLDVEGYEPQLWDQVAPLVQAGIPLQLEFSPAFYGPETTARFVDKISQCVPSVIMFRDGRQATMKSTDLAGVTRQVDILLAL